MAGFLDSLAKYDPYGRSAAGTSVRTTGGAVVTICCFLVVLYLFIHEVIVYNTVVTTEHLQVDNGHGMAEIPASIDIEFGSLKCDDIDIVTDIAKTKSHVDLNAGVNRMVLGDNTGCRVQGIIPIKKVAGVLHVAYKLDRSKPPSLGELVHYNASHVINEVSFGTPFPGMENPLTNVGRLVQLGAAQFQYHIKIVPTLYKPLSGDQIHSAQYSVTEFVKPVDPVDSFGFLSSINIPGVYIKYDFSPMIVIREQSTQSVLHFLTRICAIVGGVYTASGALDALVYSTTQKKLD